MTVKAKATVKATEKPKDKEQTAEELINGLIDKSEKALDQLRTFSQEQVDKICQNLALAAEEHHMDLAISAAEETGRGVAEDKAIKNIYASEYNDYDCWSTGGNCWGRTSY